MERTRAGYPDLADKAVALGRPSRSVPQPGTAVSLSRRTVVRLLGAIVAVLVVLSLAGQIAKFYFGYPFIFGLVPMFYLDAEANVPTWYQSMSLLLCAVLLARLAIDARRTGAPFRGHWLALAVIFLCLSIDEAAKIHEATMSPMWRLMGSRPTGIWNTGWVVLGVIAVTVVGLAYRRFVMHLGWREGLQVAAAGALFVGGAIGVEMAANVDAGEGWVENFRYVILAHVEETMEMLGVVVFLDFLLRRAATSGPFVLNVTD